ncbi:MAG: GGDEF domain-containing protein [Meiothermus sp.]|nr:GGDEF domain-containing protein [Meiothermus sp.]
MSAEKLRDEDLKLVDLIEQAQSQVLEYNGRLLELQDTLAMARRLVEERNQALLSGRNALLEGTTAEEEDLLTGLPSQAAFDRALERCHATGEVFSVVTFEVDHFTSLAGQAGSAVADEVLRRVSVQVRKVLRGSDVAGHMGQGRFALILRGIAGDRTFGVCERLRVAILKYPWSSLSPGLRVTVSLGFAARDNDNAGKEIMDRADRFQAEAISSGRNQTFPGLYY